MKILFRDYFSNARHNVIGNYITFAFVFSVLHRNMIHARVFSNCPDCTAYLCVFNLHCCGLKINENKSSLLLPLFLLYRDPKSLVWIELWLLCTFTPSMSSSAKWKHACWSWAQIRASQPVTLAATSLWKQLIQKLNKSVTFLRYVDQLVAALLMEPHLFSANVLLLHGDEFVEPITSTKNFKKHKEVFDELLLGRPLQIRAWTVMWHCAGNRLRCLFWA